MHECCPYYLERKREEREQEAQQGVIREAVNGRRRDKTCRNMEQELKLQSAVPQRQR